MIFYPIQWYALLEATFNIGKVRRLIVLGSAVHPARGFPCSVILEQNSAGEGALAISSPLAPIPLANVSRFAKIGNMCTRSAPSSPSKCTAQVVL